MRRLEVVAIIADPHTSHPFRDVVRALLRSPATRTVCEVTKLVPDQADDVASGQSQYPAGHRHDPCNPLALTLGARIVALRAGRVGAVCLDDHQPSLRNPREREHPCERLALAQKLDDDLAAGHPTRKKSQRAVFRKTDRAHTPSLPPSWLAFPSAERNLSPTTSRTNPV